MLNNVLKRKYYSPTFICQLFDTPAPTTTPPGMKLIAIMSRIHTDLHDKSVSAYIKI